MVTGMKAPFTIIPLLLMFYQSSAIEVVVNTSSPVGPLKHFWKSTGFCPPLPHESASGFDLGGDMSYNLAMIGAIPRSGIEQVRIHWLLDIVTVISHEPFKAPVYNFTLLDNVIDLLYNNGLKPGFELMGNPSGLFRNFEDKETVYLWKDLVTQVASRYIDEYGAGFVSEWNFETWNEPDCHDFDNVNMTVQGFLNYYDACSEGLKAASESLILGGPGDGCRRTDYSDALLDHVVLGTNFFTGETGVRIDFLSFHRKGSGFSKKIMDDEITLMSQIATKYPTLADKPFYNDEADPLVGWSRDEEWRADSTYASMVAKVIVQHQKAFISNKNPKIKNYHLLSNDNAFLSWYPHQFTQRTLLARFQINTTSPPHTHFFRKPVYSVMGFLSLLGETEVQATVTSNSSSPDLEANFGVLASTHSPRINGTADSWQSTVLFYVSNDTGPQLFNTYAYLYMDINPPEWASEELYMTGWWLDNTVGNPYRIWENAGKPSYPNLDLQKQMRVDTSILPRFSTSVKAGYQYIGKFFLEEPAVILVHVCSRASLPPDQPNNVNIRNITSGQILITWSDKCLNSRCILNYEVAFSPDGSRFTTLEPGYNLGMSNSLVYTPQPKQGVPPDSLVTGYYKVRAMDYFRDYSEYSLPVQYPPQGQGR
ncbi:alpha-L-iduronidase-like isoform X2 [Mya arenaria]|nr:alpha-L-iduronidase-like isoform X2 [Mya arenaria]XP_052770729.1 alpha-L-iduronidase-like isoform X2 [Mya arenaria]XP_052770731.1 alpha-L-iduronidase-like isoform X2 [Mya arenaria]